ncbi:MAG: hypothetical protein V1899_04855, partial [Planctomycetota bacterium]
VKQAQAYHMPFSQFYDQLLQKRDALSQMKSALKTRKVLHYLVEQADIKIIPRKPSVEITTPSSDPVAQDAESAEAAAINAGGHALESEQGVEHQTEPSSSQTKE